MIGSGSIEVERKVIAILRVLDQSPEPLGARIVARRLEDHGIRLTERAVRYHLKLMDERGLTQAVGRDGRLITPSGVEELRNALVSDKVGFVINRIDMLAFQSTFDCETGGGLVPVNTTFLARDKWPQALKVMNRVFKAGICVSDLVAVAQEGEKIGSTTVPPGKVGLATVCSIVLNGALLKAGVPMDSRFGGILQIRNHRPLRFVELIHYAGSSLDPSGVFIRGKMTAVGDAAKTGEGKVLANFRDIPAQCRSLAEAIIARLKDAHLGGFVAMGEAGEPVCETPVEPNRVGLILFGGMNPVAALEEAGIETDNLAMNAVLEYSQLRSIWEL
jgi:repressor of nif and glnA expression